MEELNDLANFHNELKEILKRFMYVNVDTTKDLHAELKNVAIKFSYLLVEKFNFDMNFSSKVTIQLLTELGYIKQ